MTSSNIRKPIVTFAGHVDHGKTSILDAIRNTCVAEKEPGRITQKISFTIMPRSVIVEQCKPLLEKFNIKINVPGFLFIDTPGHAAFTNLRKRGGSLADLAVLVIDINEGLKEQTRESIEILRENRVPFIVAINKIDKIPGWKPSKASSIAEAIEGQASFTKQQFDQRVLNIIIALSTLGFDSALYYEIKNFREQIALVPCSAKTAEGIADLLVMLAGLSQRFLSGRLKVGEQGRGTIFEIKKEKNFKSIEAILYDGKLHANDTIMIATFDKPVITKVRSLFEALPLATGFKQVESITAATGFKMLLVDDSGVLPGMPFVVLHDKSSDAVQQQATELQKTIATMLKLDETGIVAKADSLGSLEALLSLLRKHGIKVVRASIGDISKADLAGIKASILEDPLNGLIVGFNVDISTDIEQELKALEKENKIKVVLHDVIYKIVDDVLAWREAKQKELQRQQLEGLTLPCKLQILKHYIFHRSKPAIFGVKVIAGTLKQGITLMNRDGEKIDKIKTIQYEKKTMQEAKVGQEVAINLPHVTIGRQIKETDTLYSYITEEDFRKLKQNKHLLNADEIALLQEIAEINRKRNPVWGV